jgi:hypothetical protein
MLKSCHAKIPLIHSWRVIGSRAFCINQPFSAGILQEWSIGSGLRRLRVKRRFRLLRNADEPSDPWQSAKEKPVCIVHEMHNQFMDNVMRIRWYLAFFMRVSGQYE